MRLCDLRPPEAVRLDNGRLREICRSLGVAAGEAAIEAAMEDLAALMQRTAAASAAGDVDGLRLCARHVQAVAARLGMTRLGTVAGALAELCQGRDRAALGAVAARLIRVGEGSLLAIWDAQDLRL